MAKKSAEPSLLNFHWHKPAGSDGRLWRWLIVTALGLISFFYLFKVVYPQTRRVSPLPQQVLILNGTDPTARAILNRVQDVDHLMLPTSSDVTNPINLDERAPVFHPSFENHVFALQDLPYKAVKVRPARLLDTTTPILPPLDLSDLKDAPTVIQRRGNGPKLSMKLSGDLASRALLNTPNFAASGLTDATAYRFQLGVNARGQVSFALPISDSGTPEVSQKIMQQLAQLKFQALPAKDAAADKPVWGIASFQWSTANTP
ncbi:MAG: hypothetical protein RL693_2351 [Verrucomicrobiota bacterium]